MLPFVSQLSRQSAGPTTELGVVTVGAVLGLDNQFTVGEERVVGAVLRDLDILDLQPD